MAIFTVKSVGYREISSRGGIAETTGLWGVEYLHIDRVVEVNGVVKLGSGTD